MILNHLSTDLDLEKRTFIPRVPENVMEGEDTTQKRICLSADIQQALLSMPDSYDGLYNRYDMQQEMGIPALFTRFTLEKEEHPESSFRTPEELTAAGLVPDAIRHQEYWLLDKWTAKPTDMIWIKRLEMDIETYEVLSMEVEHSLESFEREFAFTFLYEAEFNSMKELIQTFNLQITGEKKERGFFDVGEGKYEISIVVPPNVDIASLWQEYYIIRFQYENECSEEDYGQILKYSQPFRRENSPQGKPA